MSLVPVHKSCGCQLNTYCMHGGPDMDNGCEETFVSSQPLYIPPQIIKDIIELHPPKKVVEFVCGFMFNEDASYVILLKKARPTWQAGKYNGVGGHVEEGESWLEAMVREFKEETGLLSCGWRHQVTMEVNQNAYVYCYAMRCPDFYINYKQMKPNVDEPLEIFAVKDCTVLDDKLIPGLNWLIPLCADQNISNTIYIPYTNNSIK